MFRFHRERERDSPEWHITNFSLLVHALIEKNKTKRNVKGREPKDGPKGTMKHNFHTVSIWVTFILFQILSIKPQVHLKKTEKKIAAR